MNDRAYRFRPHGTDYGYLLIPGIDWGDCMIEEHGITKEQARRLKSDLDSFLGIEPISGDSQLNRPQQRG